MTDEYLNTICFNEDHLKSYVIAMRFLPVKVKIVRVLWYLKNGKAEFKRSLKIDKDNYIPFSIPLITGENVTCKVNLRSFYEASDIEKVLKKMLMIYEGKEEPIDKIDFDIVDNEMEEEIENENENTMVANVEDNDDNKIDYNPPLYYGLIASLYYLYTLKYPIQKKWYRPFSDDKENRPIINTIVEYRRRKIVRKKIDKTRKFQMGDDMFGVQSLRCIILLSMNYSIMYIIE